MDFVAKNKLQEIHDTVLSGKNILMISPGGCGKSHLLRNLAVMLNEENVCAYCTGLTGIAALNLSAPGIKVRTLHSWAGVGLARESADKLYGKIYNNKKSKKRWRDTKVLIIDEISMLGKELFEKLNEVAKLIREDPRPFGGLTLICSGDWFQLPPVKEEFCFTSEVWDSLNFTVVPFTKPMRYEDVNWYHMLLRIRRGKHTPEDVQLLHSRVEAYEEYNELMITCDSSTGKDNDKFIVKPTVLHSLKRDVESYNLTELAKLKSESCEFKCKDTYKVIVKGTKKDYYEDMLNETIPPVISLKVGAQVMLKANIDVDRGLVNGSRGVITECLSDAVYVLFYKRTTPVKIAYYTWSIEDENMIASRSQLPFILAYACTIHKIQGCSLDFAICNLSSSVFAEGQAYVALSRVRTLDGLFISVFHESSIKTSEVSIDYSNKLSNQVVKLAYTSDKMPILPTSFCCLYVPITFSIENENFKLDNIIYMLTHDLISSVVLLINSKTMSDKIESIYKLGGIINNSDEQTIQKIISGMKQV